MTSPAVRAHARRHLADTTPAVTERRAQAWDEAATQLAADQWIEQWRRETDAELAAMRAAWDQETAK